MAEGLLPEKNSLPTDQNRNPVSANPARITTRYVISLPACTTVGMWGGRERERAISHFAESAYLERL